MVSLDVYVIMHGEEMCYIGPGPLILFSVCEHPLFSLTFYLIMEKQSTNILLN